MPDSDTPSSSQPSKRSRAIDSVKNNAQQVIKEDLGKARKFAVDAAQSRSWLYPFKGIFYFVSHRSLYKPCLDRVIPYATTYGAVLAAMFGFTYLPQLAVMVFASGPVAPVTTAILVLNETTMIVNTLTKTFLLQDSILDTFDGTLLSRNESGIVSEGREVKSGSDPIKKLGKVLKSPFEKYNLKAFVRYLLYLPLNFIPVVGTIIFVFIQARGRGRSVHDRYFQLKKWSNSQQTEWLEKNKGPYTSFGLVATLLEMIPVVSVFFRYSNTVGAALWAADLEDQEEKTEQSN